MNLKKEKIKRIIYLILFIIFTILTFIGVTFVIVNKGRFNAGYACVPMLGGLIFALLFYNSNKKIEEPLFKKYKAILPICIILIFSISGIVLYGNKEKLIFPNKNFKVYDNAGNLIYDSKKENEEENEVEKNENKEVTTDTKNYDKNLKIAYIDENNKENSRFIYSAESNDTTHNWKEYIVENKAILKGMPEIDFSKFKELDNDFYSLKITDYEQYKEYAKNYNLKQLEKSDFDNIFVEIIIRKNADNSIDYSDIIKGYEYISNEENYTFLVEINGFLDVTEEFKYPCLIAYFPNYMNKHYDDFYFNVIVKENDIKISKETALKTAQNYFNKLEYKGNGDFSHKDYVRITKEYSNNFLSTSDKENPVDNKDKKYMVWSISAYSNEDPCTWANVYIDISTGKIIGGKLNYATD